ncbi:MAG: response regulator [Gammaproteobacteria bacterium]|nr:response regulator [Gammaproteobacteria bacterium]
MPDRELQKIMLVDDSADIREIARISLEQLGGYELKLCATAEQAIAEADEFDPDLFVLDVMMPETDGPQLLLKLKELPQFAATPVIFLTAKEDITDLEAHRTLGVASIINKPFNPMTLAATVQEIWDAFDGG